MPVSENLRLVVVESAGFPVHNAQRTECEAVGIHHRRTRVEAEPGVLTNGRIIGEPFVAAEVLYREDASLENRVVAKGPVAWGFFDI